jgi:hypothetical protein
MQLVLGLYLSQVLSILESLIPVSQTAVSHAFRPKLDLTPVHALDTDILLIL